MTVNHKMACDCVLAGKLRDFIPLEGDEYSKLYLVEMKRKDGISKHDHKEHTVLYYPDEVSEICIRPTAGTIIYMPPRTTHSVPKVTGHRLSIAILADDKPEMKA